VSSTLTHDMIDVASLPFWALRPLASLRPLNDRELADLTVVARRRALIESEVLVEPERLREATFIIVAGRVRLCAVSGDGQAATLGTVGAGDIFQFLRRDRGGVPLSVATALVGPTILYAIPQPDMQRLLDASPRLSAIVLAACRAQFATTLARMKELMLYDVETRLAHVLAERAAGDPSRVVRVTHAELAQQVGTSREEVSKKLKGLCVQGFIALCPVPLPARDRRC